MRCRFSTARQAFVEKAEHGITNLSRPHPPADNSESKVENEAQVCSGVWDEDLLGRAAPLESGSEARTRMLLAGVCRGSAWLPSVASAGGRPSGDGCG